MPPRTKAVSLIVTIIIGVYIEAADTLNESFPVINWKPPLFNYSTSVQQGFIQRGALGFLPKNFAKIDFNNAQLNLTNMHIFMHVSVQNSSECLILTLKDCNFHYCSAWEGPDSLGYCCKSKLQALQSFPVEKFCMKPWELMPL